VWVKHRNIAILIFCLFAFSSCKEELKPYCSEYPNECADIKGVKDYFAFNEGSYWVYEEVNSGAMDCVYVTSFYNDANSYYFDVEHHSVHSGYDYRFWTSSSAVENRHVKKEEVSLLVKLSKYKPGDFVSESYCFIYYPTVGNLVHSDGGQPYGYDNELVVNSYYENYIIGNKTCSNVIVMTEEHTASENKQPTIKYYAEGIGLIRKELIDSNQVWNLKDYNISQ